MIDPDTLAAILEYEGDQRDDSIYTVYGSNVVTWGDIRELIETYERDKNALIAVRDLHFNRGGYCNEGCGEHPCITYRRVTHDHS